MQSLGLPLHDETTDLALGQVQSCVADIGQILTGPDAEGLEQQAQALLRALETIKIRLSVEKDLEQKTKLKKNLRKMSLQLEHQRVLMTKRALIVGQQLDSLLPPRVDVTYKRAYNSPTERPTLKTSFQA